MSRPVAHALVSSTMDGMRYEKLSEELAQTKKMRKTPRKRIRCEAKDK